MVKCPFCQYDNEDGALFCEQCKSDLGALPVAHPLPAHPAEAVPMAGLVEPFAALAAGLGDAPEPARAEAVPVAEAPNPFDFTAAPPPTAAPVEPSLATPVTLEVPAAAAVPVAEVAPVIPPQAEVAPVAPVAETVPAAEAPVETLVTAPVVAETVVPVAAAVPITPPAAPPVVPGPAPAAPAETDRLPAGAQPKLVVLRGLKINTEFPLYEGHNFIGRADEKPVDIDLEDQEPPDRIWSSRQHAVITYEDGRLIIEDLNSANGTFVNRSRIHPGQKRPIKVNDIIQIGTVQLKVKV
jgi:hypothetical protein